MKLSLALTTAARMLGSVTFSTAHNRDTGLDPAGLSPGHGHHEASKNAETTKPRRRVPIADLQVHLVGGHRSCLSPRGVEQSF